jgi:hypothetical protein
VSDDDDFTSTKNLPKSSDRQLQDKLTQTFFNVCASTWYLQIEIVIYLNDNRQNINIDVKKMKV